jgi:hypothetical protein
MKNPLFIVPLPAPVQVEPFASFECSRPLEPELVKECVAKVEPDEVRLLKCRGVEDADVAGTELEVGDTEALETV